MKQPFAELAPSRTIKYGSIWFAVWYLLAFAAYPHPATISYLGNMKLTIVQYTIAMLGLAYSLWRAGRQMIIIPGLRWVGYSLMIMGILFVLTLAAPYTVNYVFFVAHMSIAAVLFVLGLALSLIIGLRVKEPWLYNVWAMQLFALGCLLYTLQSPQSGLIWELQFVYELAFGVGFSLVLQYGIRYMITKKLPKHI